MAAEFSRMSEDLGAILGRVNCGVVTSGNNAIVIDTGIDEGFGRRISAILSENSLRLVAILNTHAHSDHFSGNAILVERTSAKVFCPKIESDTLRNPELEGYALWGMAKSPAGTKNKHLMGVQSPVDFEISKEGPVPNLPEAFSIEAISLPGHSFNQMGYLSRGTLFAGDSIFSGETLEKHKLLFCSDVGQAISTLEKIKELHSEGKITRVVPGHGSVFSGEEIPGILERNKSKLSSASETVLSFASACAVEYMVSRYAESIGQSFGLTQYFLHLTIFKAHLSYLEETGKVRSEMRENRLIWDKC